MFTNWAIAWLQSIKQSMGITPFNDLGYKHDDVDKKMYHGCLEDDLISIASCNGDVIEM